MGRGADDSPREWILEVEKRTSPWAYDCLLPSLFSWMRKVAAQRDWQEEGRQNEIVQDALQREAVEGVLRKGREM